MSNARFYPTLKTVLLVEHLLSNNRATLFSKAAILRGLNGRVNNKSLTTILEYLEASGKILCGSKGIMWIASDGKKARQLMKDALVF